MLSSYYNTIYSEYQQTIAYVTEQLQSNAALDETMLSPRCYNIIYLENHQYVRRQIQNNAALDKLENDKLNLSFTKLLLSHTLELVKIAESAFHEHIRTQKAITHPILYKARQVTLLDPESSLELFESLPTKMAQAVIMLEHNLKQYADNKAKNFAKKHKTEINYTSRLRYYSKIPNIENRFTRSPNSSFITGESNFTDTRTVTSDLFQTLAMIPQCYHEETEFMMNINNLVSKEMHSLLDSQKVLDNTLLFKLDERIVHASEKAELLYVGDVESAMSSPYMRQMLAVKKCIKTVGTVNSAMLRTLEQHACIKQCGQNLELLLTQCKNGKISDALESAQRFANTAIQNTATEQSSNVQRALSYNEKSPLGTFINSQRQKDSNPSAIRAMMNTLILWFIPSYLLPDHNELDRNAPSHTVADPEVSPLRDQNRSKVSSSCTIL